MPTQQQFKNKNNPNVIMKRAIETGQVPANKSNLMYGVMPSVDFMTAQNAVIDARNAFDSLPAKIRRRFLNDPHQLLRALEQPEMRPELIELGIIKPDPKPAEKAESTPKP